ncbi:cyclin [Aspergillus fumigatus Z5]|nr:cyclin [Aspergillus fumigatus Z5]
MASAPSHSSQKRPLPAEPNPVLHASQTQWLFTDEELTRTPSQLDGMKMEAEHTSRSKGVNFITQVGIMLKLPQLTLATAAVYLHRFFMRYSMVDIPQRPERSKNERACGGLLPSGAKATESGGGRTIQGVLEMEGHNPAP